MKFIGRHRELKDLESEYRNGHSFVVVYGDVESVNNSNSRIYQR